MFLLTGAIWLGGLVSGWYHFAWWLVIAPAALALTLFGISFAVAERTSSNSTDARNYVRHMVIPNLVYVLWHSVICAILWAFAWLITELGT